VSESGAPPEPVRRLEIVTIGDELLLGFTIDTNGAFLGRTLAAAGIEIVRRTTVGDGAADITRAVGDALERTGAVITTGGLGPTSDDATKPAIARLFGRDMRMDETIANDLRARWTARGWPGTLPTSNLQQAMIPESATILANRHGSAPGIWLEDDRGRWVAMLPGVPREMRGMLADTLLPRIAGKSDIDRPVIRSLTLRTTGIGESSLADLLGELASGIPGTTLAFLPGTAGVDLRVTVRGVPLPEATSRLENAAALLRERANPHVYGADDADLAAVVLDACRIQGFTLAVAESCTGGMLGARITAVPGSSDVFVGGVIAYADAIKSSYLAVPGAMLQEHGAVSEDVARAMASGVRAVTGADIGIAITGVAGPGGGSADKPVGTVCWAVDMRQTVKSRRRAMVGDRGEIRERSAQAALELVRRMLMAG